MISGWIPTESIHLRLTGRHREPSSSSPSPSSFISFSRRWMFLLTFVTNDYPRQANFYPPFFLFFLLSLVHRWIKKIEQRFFQRWFLIFEMMVLLEEEDKGSLDSRWWKIWKLIFYTSNKGFNGKLENRRNEYVMEIRMIQKDYF